MLLHVGHKFHQWLIHMWSYMTLSLLWSHNNTQACPRLSLALVATDIINLGHDQLSNLPKFIIGPDVVGLQRILYRDAYLCRVGA